MKIDAFDARLAYVLAMSVLQSKDYETADDELRVAVSWGLQRGRDAGVLFAPIASIAEPSR